MRSTLVVHKARGGGKGGRISFRRTWMTPGLTSGQLLDAGVTLRQSQSRKNLKKGKRPFDLLFRDQFRCAMHAPPAVGKRGILSARDATRLMTDAEASWGAPWAVRAAGVRTRHRRQDALETPLEAFGEDDLDSALERLIELRFQWDREDGVLATSQVPESLYAVTEHCAPYSPEFEAKAKQREEAAQGGDREDEYVVVDGTRIHIGKLMRPGTGHPKATFRRPRWGFTGVDTVPSIVTDVVQGPLLSSTNEPHLTLRWKAENRAPESVAEVMRLRRAVMASSVVGLPPRSAFLLLKSAATTEMEDPALDVALLIALAEHYNSYEMTECLEALRCVRRLALARGLPTIPMAVSGSSTANALGEVLASPAPLLSSSADDLGDAREQHRPVGIPLYENATLTQDLLGRYVRDAAPSFAAKVWARLPEHSQRLLNHQYYLDWFDLLSLTLETTGPSRLPEGLPNAASNARYASKYLFFHHTLGLDDKTMRGLVSHMLSSADAVAAAATEQSKNAARCNNSSSRDQEHEEGDEGSGIAYVNEETESRVKPLVLWMCASFLARLVAECLGDVLHHVGQSLQRHAQLAAEEDEERGTADTHDNDTGCAAPDLDAYLDRLGLPRPQMVGVPPLQGRMRPTKMRIRLLPYEAFPSVFRVLPTPARSATAQALQMERNRRQHGRALRRGLEKSCTTNAVALSQAAAGTGERRLLESPFAAVLQSSALAAKHVERATAALEWSTMMVGHCHRLVRTLRRPEQAIGSFPAAPSGASRLLVGVGLGTSGGVEHAAVKGAPRGMEDGLVIAQREALCERYARAKVELHMDAIFAFVPWNEVESGLEPLLRIEQPTKAEPEAAAQPVEAMSSEAELLALSLADDDSSDVGSPGPAEEANPSETATDAKAEELTEAEQQMRATLAKLQSCIGDFQIAVADLLDAHERFFGAEEENGGGGASTEDSASG